MATSLEKRVTAASLIAGSVEYYEFFIYGMSATLVFNKLFFPSFNATAGTLLSLSTFALAFLARPVGAWIFGHFGDRIGRKSVFVITLMGMGGATTLIGCLPSFDTIGVASPILLVLLRIVQGLSLGGENAGGFVMTFEHTSSGGRPGLFLGTVSTGNMFGLLLSNGVFFLVQQLPSDQFQAWGWRLPFLLSAVLVGVGFYVQRRLEESPEFAVVKAEGHVSRSPALEALRRHPGGFLMVMLSTIPQSVVFYSFSVFALSYAKSIHVNGTLVTLAVMLISALLIIGFVFFGWLADRTGRPRLLFGIGLAIMMISPFVWFPLFNTGRPGLVLLGFVLLVPGFAANYGTQGVVFPTYFPAHLRYSGIAVSVAVAGVLGGAFAPMISIALLDGFRTWVAIALYIGGTCLLGLLATMLVRPLTGRAESLPAAQVAGELDPQTS